MTSADIEYYSRRERQERESAERSSDHGARLVHLELANRYSAMLSEMGIARSSAAQPAPAQQA